MSLPEVGDIVLYRSKVGDGIDSPAMVLRTQETTDLEVLAGWDVEGVNTLSGKGRPPELVPELSSEHHVDLVVFGLGGLHWQYNVPFDATRDITVPPNSWRDRPNR